MWIVYPLVSLLCFISLVSSRPDSEQLAKHVSKNSQLLLESANQLQTKLEDDLKNSLTPADAKNIRNDMAKGLGGTTIATFDGKTPRSFIFSNSVRRICNGILKGMECEGTIEPFTITVKEDYCYATSYASLNNDICLSSLSVRITFTNNTFVCTSGDGSPTLTLTKQQYRDLCNEVTSRHVVYKYYTNSSDPNAIPVPNPNPHVQCLNNEPGVCEFAEDKTIPGTAVPSKGNENTSSSKNSTFTFSYGINGANTLFQGIEVIFLTIIAKFIFKCC